MGYQLRGIKLESERQYLCVYKYSSFSPSLYWLNLKEFIIIHFQGSIPFSKLFVIAVYLFLGTQGVSVSDDVISACCGLLVNQDVPGAMPPVGVSWGLQLALSIAHSYLLSHHYPPKNKKLEKKMFRSASCS